MHLRERPDGLSLFALIRLYSLFRIVKSGRLCYNKREI